MFADHLDTPRRIVEPTSKKVVWYWEGEAFGNTYPDEDPDKDSVKLTYNLRYPGQYYLRDMGWFHNWNRDYNPALGRYLQSDPIGLQGGINTYAYVSGNPIGQIDPMGLMGAGTRPTQPPLPINKGDGCKVPRAPDFVNFQLDLYVGSVWGTFSRDGNSFVGGGLNRTYANPINLNGSVSFGWLNTWSVSSGQTNNFLAGYAGGGTAAYVGFGGGIVDSPGNGTATVAGFGAGYTYGPAGKTSGGLGGGYSKDMGNTGMSWSPSPSKCGCQ